MKKTILFVDDEEINLLILERIFGEFYSVLTANCGESAMRIIKENSDKISAIISDMKMPGMTGIELFEQMRSTLGNTPCFLLTAYDYSDEIDKALHEKLILKRFSKPFDVQEINSTLQQFI